MISPTGTQHTLVHGNQQAVVTELGAALRSYTVGGREVVLPFAPENSPIGCQGQHLMPWPNRIRDGRWVHEGVQLQLPLSEPERGNAIHGLVCWVPWTTLEQSDEHLVQRYLLHPQPGWPGVVELQLEHRLSDDGLSVTVRARNLGDQAVPFGYGAHPYLLPPDGTLADCTLQVPFSTVLGVDERLLPTETRPVDQTVADLRQPKLLAGVGLDTAFTGAERVEGRWGISLQGSGHRTLVWGDESMRWAQLYTPGDGRSLAVEPMTCGPDAFNPGATHDDLVVLEPGEDFVGQWGIVQRGLEDGVDA